MSGTKVTDLPAYTSAKSSDVLYAVTEGSSKNITVGNLLNSVTVGFTGIFNVKNDGAVGDGVADESTALIKTRDQLPTDKHSIMYFPPGHYKYLNNRWLLGVHSVTVWAYGATLECTNSTDPFNANKRPFNMFGTFRDEGDVPESSPFTIVIGDLINTTAIGDTSVTLTSGGAYAIGDRVLLHGFNHQNSDSHPPNLRYFQYNKIRSISGSVLTLHDPVQYVFSSTWLDLRFLAGENIGKPRIIKLNRPLFNLPVFIEILGATFINTENRHIQIASEKLIMRDCIGEGLSGSPSENRVAIYENCLFGGCEVDKLIDYCRYSRCEFKNRDLGVFGSNNMGGARGCNTLIIEDCDIHVVPQMSPRTMIYQRNKFLVPAGVTSIGAVRHPDNVPPSTFVFEDNTVSHDGGLSWIIDNALVKNFTVSSAGSANEIKITSVGREALFEGVAIDSFLWADDLSDWGRITAITHDGTDYIITGTWKAAPSGLWHYFPLQNLRESGTAQFGKKVPIARELFAPSRRKSDDDGLVKIHIDDAFDFGFAFLIRTVLGYVHKAALRVRRPYTGASINPRYRLKFDHGAGQVEYISMDLNVTGYAETRIDGTFANPASPFTLVQLDSTKVTEAFQLSFKNGSPLLGSDFEMPKISLYLEIEPLD